MKRTKKSARKAAEIAAIRARLIDLAQGALGQCVMPDFKNECFGGMAAELGIEVFSRWVGAVQAAFGSDDERFDALWMLAEYDSIDRAAEWLHDRGVRP